MNNIAVLADENPLHRLQSKGIRCGIVRFRGCSVNGNTRYTQLIIGSSVIPPVAQLSSIPNPTPKHSSLDLVHSQRHLPVQHLPEDLQLYDTILLVDRIYIINANISLTCSCRLSPCPLPMEGPPSMRAIVPSISLCILCHRTGIGRPDPRQSKVDIYDPIVLNDV